MKPTALASSECNCLLPNANWPINYNLEEVQALERSGEIHGVVDIKGTMPVNSSGMPTDSLPVILICKRGDDSTLRNESKRLENLKRLESEKT